MTMDIRANEFVGIMADIKGGTMTSLTTKGSVRVKKGCPFRNVTKITYRTSVRIGASYENCVNAKLDRKGEEDNFKTGHLPFGRWYIYNRIVAHKGEYYARFYLTDKTTESVAYYIDGRLATPNETAIILSYEYKEQPFFSFKQYNYGLNEWEQVRPIVPKVSNIVKMCADNCEYVIVAEKTARA